MTLDNNQLSGTWSSYIGSQLTHKKEYDYGLVSSAGTCTNSSGSITPPSATPTRETVITYQTFGATSISDRPSSIKVYGNGILAAETDYLYDQTAVATVSNLPSGTHDETNYGPSFNTRGNATTVTRKCLQSCADSVTTFTYDETGQPLTSKDPKGNTTQ